MKHKFAQAKASGIFHIYAWGILCISLVAAQVFASESSLAQLVEGAKKEGRVVVYSTITIDQSTMIGKGFEAKYPFLKAEQVRVSGGAQFASRILQEANMKKDIADVISGTPVNLYLLRQKGLTAPYRPAEPVLFRQPFHDSEGYAHPIYLMSFIIGYNTRFVPKEALPKKYDDLLDPRWKGKIGMGQNIEWFPFVLSKLGEEKGLDFMRRLVSQQKVRTRDGDTLNATLLAAGEMQILINVYSQTIERQKSLGAPVDWLPFNPTLTKAQVATVSARAPHPNAARLYLDYLTSKDGQKIIGGLNRIPARQDVRSISPRMEEGAVFEAQDISWLVNPETFKRYYGLYRDIFKGAD